MLVSNQNIMNVDPLSIAIAEMNGRSGTPIELQEGIYQIGHFGGSHMLPGYEHYPNFLSISPYGVCDNVENLLNAEPELQCGARMFTITLTPITRATQPENGGWRWHKWGEYLGTQNPEHEYIYDEVSIDLVYCYHIYEKI